MRVSLLCVSVIRCGSEVNLAPELKHFDNFQVAYCCVVLIAVRYSSNPLSKKCYFGHVGGANPNLTFVLQKAAPVFALKSRERRDRLSNPSMLTFREIMINGRFESDTRITLKKPDFFFGDAIAKDDRILYDRDYKWLHQIGDMRFFLPNMERMYPLAYLQHMSIRRTWSGSSLSLSLACPSTNWA